MVQLRAAFQAEGELASADEVSSQRAAIARAQDRILADLSNYRVSNIKRLRFAPYLALTVNEAGLRGLLNHPTVAHLHRDEMLEPSLAQSVPLINADDVWATGFIGTGVTVAILDTGVDKSHLFLDQGKVVSEACFSTNNPAQAVSTVCPNGQTSQIGFGAGINCPLNIDGCEHGTHVAGIAAGNAAGTNRPDLSGVAKDASIIAIQVFSRVDNVAACSAGGHSTPCARTFRCCEFEPGRGAVLQLLRCAKLSHWIYSKPPFGQYRCSDRIWKQWVYQ
jgi:subtilisin family serine protease